MMKNIYTVLGAFFCILSLNAQNPDSVPLISEIEGDYILVNSKIYEGTKGVSDSRALHLSVTEDDSLFVEGFYMKGSIPFKAGFNTKTGHISIKSGIKIFDFSDDHGEGTCQFLYAWDEKTQKATDRPIVYRYNGNNKWEFRDPIVLMTGLEGGQLTPYYFSQGSNMFKANAVTKNLSYVGQGNEQQKWDESRPSYVSIEQNEVTVYNMLQIDAHGYGCWVTFNLSSDSVEVYTEPTIIGQVNNISYPYKALAGCDYDDEVHKPTQLVYDGTNKEGMLEGRYLKDEGAIELEPMAIWPAYVENKTWNIERGSYYEFVRSVKILLNDKETGIEPIKEAAVKEIVNIEYYTISGQKVDNPFEGELYIRVITYKDKSQESNKILFMETSPLCM